MPCPPPPLCTFLIEAVLQKVILQKLTEGPKNQGVHAFPDPVGHIWTPLRPFLILQAVLCCSWYGIAGGTALQAMSKSTWERKVKKITKIVRS